MTKHSTFRLPDGTLADLDVIGAQVDISRTEVICRGVADLRAKVTGLVPASAIEAPPYPPVATEERPQTVPSTPPVIQARRDPLPRPTFGPVQSLRSTPLAVPDLPRVHRSLNPITRGRLGREQGS